MLQGTSGALIALDHTCVGSAFGGTSNPGMGNFWKEKERKGGKERERERRKKKEERTEKSINALKVF